MRIYLDACCLSRLTDDQTQSRIRQEAQAVERTLQLVEESVATWMASQVLFEEVAGKPTGGTESGQPGSVGDGVGNHQTQRGDYPASRAVAIRRIRHL